MKIATPLRDLSVVIGPDRFDVVVDARLTVGQTMRLLRPGVPLEVRSMTGLPVCEDGPVGEAVEAGSMLLARRPGVRTDTPPRDPARNAATSRFVRPETARRARGVVAMPVVVGWLVWAVAAGVMAYGVVAGGWSRAAVGAMSLAVAVLVARVVPELAFRIDRDLLLDPLEVGSSGGPDRVDRGSVETRVRQARSAQTALLAGASLTCALATALLSVRPLGAPAYPLLVAAALALLTVSRTHRRPRDRYALQLAAAGCLCGVVLHLATTIGAEAPDLLVPGVALTAVVVAIMLLVMAAVSPRRRARVRPALWMVRVGDALGALCLVGVPALSLWTAGVVESVATAALSAFP